LIDECTRLLEGELQDGLECSIKEFLRIKEYLDEESRRLYHKGDKEDPYKVWWHYQTDFKEGLNQMLLKDLDESNQQALLVQFTSDDMPDLDISGFFSWFSACSDRAKSVCDVLVLLRQILSFTTQCLYNDYLRSLYTISTLAEEMERKLTFFQSCPYGKDCENRRKQI
jgi:hypothetical protein